MDNLTKPKLPDWFDEEKAQESVLHKVGHLDIPTGSMIRMFFVRFNLDKPGKSPGEHIWVLWLPNNQMRFFPDPANLSEAFAQSVLRETQLRTFDVEDLPDEFMETIYV